MIRTSEPSAQQLEAIDSPDRLNSWLRRIRTEQRRRLAALNTAPELALGTDNQVLIEGISVGGDFDPRLGIPWIHLKR